MQSQATFFGLECTMAACEYRIIHGRSGMSSLVTVYFNTFMLNINARHSLRHANQDEDVQYTVVPQLASPGSTESAAHNSISGTVST